MAKRLWLAVHFHQLALDIHTRGLAEVPAMVITQRSSQGDQVWQLSKVAQNAGIRHGMRLAQARALLEPLAVYARREAEEANMLRHLADGLWRFSSQLSLQMPDVVVLEVGASLKLFSGLQPLVDQVEEQLQQSGFSAHFGLAHTPAAALLLAHEGRGRCVSDAQSLHQALQDIPIETAAMDARQKLALKRSGLDTLAQLLRLPAAARARRFGQPLEDYLQRLTGERADPQISYRPAERFRADLQLPSPVTQAEALQFAGNRLLADLDSFLLARQKGIQRFCLLLQHQERHVACTRVEIGLAAIGRHRQHWQQLLGEKLQSLVLHDAVEGLQLETGTLFDYRAEHGDLFGQQQQQPARQLIERLRSRLGGQRVQSLASVDDHRPECAWRYQPDALKPSTNSPLPPGRRPFWLLPSPKPLPMALDSLAMLAGPERIESGWWDQHDARRDYYIARTREGRHLWVYQELAMPRRWYVHGLFD